MHRGKEISIPIVSIIIPVYNAEKYIRECLDSLLQQTYPYFEIICVDDGSQDHSCEILRKYEECDKRISVIAQKNQYAGVARNTGMEKAKGKYLLFLDADDFFCKNMVEQLLCCAERLQTDILIFDAFKFDNLTDRIVEESWKAVQPELFNGTVRAASDICENIFNITIPAPWNKFFRREFIMKNQIYFQTLPRANDLYFSMYALSCAQRIGVLNEKLVYYRVNNDKSLQGTNYKTPAAFLFALEALFQSLCEKNVYSLFQESYIKLFSSLCIANLSLLGKEQFRDLAVCIKESDVTKSLNLCGQNEFVDRARGSIGKKMPMMLYGAGVCAKSMVKTLGYLFHVEKSLLKIIVTDVKQNADRLEGIPICAVDVLSGQDLAYLFFICNASSKTRGVIRDMLADKGAVLIEEADEKSILSLILSGVEGDRK